MSLTRQIYLRITVNEKKIYLNNPDNHVLFPVMDIDFTLYDENKNQLSSMKLADLNHSATHFFSDVNENSFVEIDFTAQKITTMLPSKISSHLIHFLKVYRPIPNGNYCCMHFAYEMTYGRNNKIDEIYKKDFYDLSTCSFSEKKLNSGDIVHLFNPFRGSIPDLSNQHHYALYLGSHYYLSLSGTEGPLMIATLDAMKKAFETTRCVQTIPKQKKSSMLNNSCFFKASLTIGLGVVGLTNVNAGIGLAAATIGFVAAEISEELIYRCTRR